ncbi:MAG: outer membrane protein assembly factor BamD [Nitrospirae bacterium]|uniref:tetratricopeptide repeat protein n=1 Tax=Candidatus Magnetobacterium casense TaxID=1455061 RepID=UPI00058D5285|nr:outer membrane protein assembly factor BamD [Candidatus Magnetobacterium casensis]MBF0338098.1 outer membrane protein assembly factor BamD [Nitrospirota bacterium]
MKRLVVLLAVVIVLLLPGCAGKKDRELFETAQFEEKQNNREHARQLYEEIVTKYPDSEYATKAKERLSDIKK